MINDKDAVFSSREESVIIKINNIYENPSIDYLIHSGSLYKGTKYEKLLLKQKGNFVGHAGQHTITVEHDASLPNGQYYLFMYNNNFGSAKHSLNLTGASIRASALTAKELPPILQIFSR